MFVQFCDEVRQEINGKYILIGCYGGSIITSHFPFATSLSAFLSLDPIDPGFEFSARYTLTSGGFLGEMSFRMEAFEPGPFQKISQVPLFPLRLQLSAPDTLILQVSINGSPYVEAGRLQIALDIVRKQT